jgi:hypothetical protein
MPATPGTVTAVAAMAAVTSMLSKSVQMILGEKLQELALVGVVV